MKSQICAMPVRCHKCGLVLDLQYDPGYLGEENIMELLKAGKQKPFICWRCRNEQ